MPITKQIALSILYSDSKLPYSTTIYYLEVQAQLGWAIFHRSLWVSDFCIFSYSSRSKAYTSIFGQNSKGKHVSAGLLPLSISRQRKPSQWIYYLVSICCRQRCRQLRIVNIIWCIPPAIPYIWILVCHVAFKIQPLSPLAAFPLPSQVFVSITFTFVWWHSLNKANWHHLYLFSQK